MKNPTLIILISLILFSSTPAFAYECSHDHHEAEYEPMILESAYDTKEIQAVDIKVNGTYQPIRIHAEYSGIAHLNSSLQTFIRQILIPSAIEDLQKIFSLIPEHETMTINKDMCNDAPIPEEFQRTEIAADLVIFVMSKTEKTNLTLASASACLMQMETWRPVAGRINLNTGALELNNTTWKRQINTVTHELLHVLGFSKALFSKYRTQQPVVKDVIRRGMPTRIITTPKVVEVAKQYFNCSNIEGVELENEGEPGSRGSHWERRILGDEIMTSTTTTEPVFSVFTLALLEDSGWYRANYSYAQPLKFGKSKGCDFLEKSCIDEETKTSRFPEFCAVDGEKRCTFNHFELARCRISPRENLPAAFNYFGNGMAGWDRFADGCPTPDAFYMGDCRNTNGMTPGVTGDDSRCFRVVQQTGTGIVGCFKRECKLTGNGKSQLFIEFAGKKMACPIQGGSLPISTTTGIHQVECPPVDSICPFNALESEENSDRSTSKSSFQKLKDFFKKIIDQV